MLTPLYEPNMMAVVRWFSEGYVLMIITIL